MVKPHTKTLARAQRLSAWLALMKLHIFAWIICKATPYNGGNAGDNYLFDDVWETYPSIHQALPRLIPQIVRAIYLRSVKAFCLRMVAAELCILVWFWFFTDVHTLSILALLALTFLGLLVREAYVVPHERLWYEVLTAFAIVPMVIFLDTALGLLSPSLLTPLESLSPSLGAASAVIALSRYHLAPEVGPEHPYKKELQQHHLTWYWNDFWLALWMAYLLTNELGAPAKSQIQSIATTTPAMIFFATAIRFQLNPLSGNYRHRMIWVKLFTNPYEDDVRMKREYLLVGADWSKNFCLQSLLEILAFVVASIPLVIDGFEWYTGDPYAARFNWFRIGLSAAAYVTLLVTWPYVKELNRRTRRVLDRTIHRFGNGPKNNCNQTGTSNVMSCERTNMTGENNIDEIFNERFDELFRQNRLRFLHTALRITGNYHEAEEALQDGFLKVIKVFKSADRKRLAELLKNPVGFLYQAIYNAALDRFRKQKHHLRTYRSKAECEEIPAPDIPELDRRIPYLREALTQIKPKLVQTLNLCEVEEMSCQEVAKMLHRPRGTVLTDLWRAKRQVKKLIRIEEKRHEGQKNKRQGIPGSGLADPSGA